MPAPRAKKRRIIDDPPRLAPPLLRIVLRRMAGILAKMPEEPAEPAFQRHARAFVSLPARTPDPDIRAEIAAAEMRFALAVLRAGRRPGR